MTAQQRVEAALHDFNWFGYGMDDVGTGLSDDPGAQEWVTDLAAYIAGSLSGANVSHEHAAAARRERQANARQLKAKGFPVATIARRLEVSERTVQRYLSETFYRD